MRWLLAALALAVGIGGAAKAAVVQPFDYRMDLTLVSHTALEMVSTPSKFGDDDWIQEVCYLGQACFPKSFAPQDAPFHVAEFTTARFWRNEIGGYGCEIGGIALDCYTNDPNDLVEPVLSYFFCCSLIGGLDLDLAAGKLIYDGEGGNYRPYAYPGCAPLVANFCDYYGVKVEYQITRVIPAIPLPASVWLLAGALGGLGAMSRRRRRLSPALHLAAT